MSNYSKELISEVINFVKDERNAEENQNFINIEVALPKKDFSTLTGLLTFPIKLPDAPL